MLSSLTEAKIGLEYLIDQCSSAQASLALLRNDHEVSLKNNESLSKTNAELQKKLDMLSSVHEDQIVSLSREHEEKVLFLLRQCQGEGNVDERIRIQETEINKMSHLNEVLIQMKDENSRLKSELDHNKFPAPSIGGKPILKTKVLLHEQVEESEEEDMSMDDSVMK
eukprot:TRINITY_DN4605_c0_g1_i1.p1 TRINITY_DN4605_c0_g1~~TRINITY_DN4605_c0_g1_i1.p1  ORF type:complete len:167 (-),score=73.77 TRINITY_DN4605_c0_g1_i1:103-603(-)